MTNEEVIMAYTYWCHFLWSVLSGTKMETQSDSWKIALDMGVVTLQCDKCNAKLTLTLETKNEAILHRKLCGLSDYRRKKVVHVLPSLPPRVLSRLRGLHRHHALQKVL